MLSQAANDNATYYYELPAPEEWVETRESNGEGWGLGEVEGRWEGQGRPRENPRL